MKKKIAIIYHSRTGHSTFIAKELAKNLGIPEKNIELIKRKVQPKTKFQEFVSNLPVFGNFEIKDVELIERLEANEFDYLIFGSPIQAWKVSPESRNFLKLIQKDIPKYNLKNLIFFQSCGGSKLSTGINSFAKELRIENKEDILGLRIRDNNTTKEKDISEFSEKIKATIKKEENQEKSSIQQKRPVNPFYKSISRIVAIASVGLTAGIVYKYYSQKTKAS